MGFELHVLRCPRVWIKKPSVPKVVSLIYTGLLFKKLCQNCVKLEDKEDWKRKKSCFKARVVWRVVWFIVRLPPQGRGCLLQITKPNENDKSARKGLNPTSGTQFGALPLVKLVFRSARAVVTIGTWSLHSLPNSHSVYFVGGERDYVTKRNDRPWDGNGCRC